MNYATPLFFLPTNSLILEVCPSLHHIYRKLILSLANYSESDRWAVLHGPSYRQGPESVLHLSP